jgi:hypothetical protein
MQSRRGAISHIGLTVALCLMLVYAGASLAYAAEPVTVTQTLTGGTRSASVSSMTLALAPYSHTAQSSVGTVTLSVDDSSGSGQGWNVLVQSSDFQYAGPNHGVNIPAANFSIVTANAPTAVAGQAVDASNGPKPPSTGADGSLDTPRKTMQALANAGMGTYTQTLAVRLLVPAQSLAGSYTGTVTTTIVAAP